MRLIERFGNGLGRTLIAGLVALLIVMLWATREAKHVARERSEHGEASLDSAITHSMAGHARTHAMLDSLLAGECRP